MNHPAPLRRFALNINAFVKHYLGGLYHRAGEHHIFLFAGGLAFSIIVCIVPFLLILFALMGTILKAGAIQQQIGLFIETMIPYPSYADFVKATLTSRIEEVIAFKKMAGYTGVIGLLFAASGLFSSMRTVLNRIYNVHVDLHAVIGKLRDIGMIFVVLIFFLLSIFVLPLLDVLEDYVGRVESLQPFRFITMRDSFFSLFSYTVMFTLFFFLYSFIPSQRLDKKVTALSAWWATALWGIASEAFGYYITHLASIRRIYGTYALMVVVIIWLYYTSLVFILGAEIGQLYRERYALLQQKKKSEKAKHSRHHA
ncbi:MAG: YihY/virulence factor BrkB family protein [candidate division KSB1 bacterium]|nr:YihY/virulence factor BrkB family protein [candidate division KSB1 bacterium]